MGSKTERFYKIELMIRHRGRVSFEDMLSELEVSRATLKRDLQFLRDRMGAPIITTGVKTLTVSQMRVRPVTSTSCRACGSISRSCMRC